jgi:hypothetical protein
MRDVLLRRNLPHVVTVYGNNSTEELFTGPVNPRDVILGIAELNKNKVCLLDISVGNSREGTTKIDSSVLENGSMEGTRPKPVDFLPEGDEYVLYKSDSWALGEFLVRNVYHPEGKTIPKRFMKSQKLLDTFIDSIGGEGNEILKKLLRIKPDEREYTWNIIKEENSGCTVQ